MTEIWPEKKLKEIASIRVSNVDKKTNLLESSVKLCNYMDIYSNDYITNKIQFMEATASQAEIERFILEEGDVIITKDSETPDDIGRSSVIIEEIKNLVCGYHLALIKPNKDIINSVYLSKQLSTSRVERYFALRASGSTRFGLSVSDIESVAISLPSIEEQSKIAEILSTIDSAIEQTEALIAKQQRVKTGLMQDLLSCGIDENGNVRSEQTHQFKDSLLGRIPIEWDVGRFGAYAKLQGGFAFSSKNAREFGVRWLKISNVGVDNVIWEEESFLPEGFLTDYINFSLMAGDAVVALTRPVIKGDLKIALLSTDDVPSVLNQRVARIVLQSKNDLNFVLSLMKSKLYVNQVENVILGSDPPNISTSQMEDMIVPVISLIEQQRISSLLNVQIDIQLTYEQQLQKFIRLKKALMHDLLTGKKRVTALLEEAEVACV